MGDRWPAIAELMQADEEKRRELQQMKKRTTADMQVMVAEARCPACGAVVDVPVRVGSVLSAPQGLYYHFDSVYVEHSCG